MRDLSSVQMTCKAWTSNAQRHLYANIEIVGDDNPLMLQKWRLSRGARLIRLRSTLRSDSLLAALVKKMHVPDPHIPLYLPNDYPNPDYDGYLCILASVVMSCPNLEALTGFVPFYNHTFDRLTYALSTRTKLRQHTWVVAENDDVSARSQTQLPPGLLDDQQLYEFTHYHDRWIHLETLMLCSPGSLGVIEHDLFIHILHSLPSLENLCISSFDADDFHDKTLLSLPPVRCLRLEECPGVTENGLTRWAASPSAARVKELILLYQSIMALSTLSKLLASLNCMTKFTVMQSDSEPSFTQEEEQLALQPTLASSSLTFIHWDILCRENQGMKSTRANATFSHAPSRHRMSANAHLAQSIRHGGFPQLQHLRAPRDTAPYGILQSVCLPAPEHGFLLPNDKDGMDDFHAKPYSNSLAVARIRAQRMARQAVQQQALSQNASQSMVRTTNRYVETDTRGTTGQDDTTSVVSHKGPEYSALRRDDDRGNGVSHSAKKDTYHRVAGSPLLPPRHPLHFNTATFGYGQIHLAKVNQGPATTFWRPQFLLEPNVVGRDQNGGLVGWAELLGIQEKAKAGSGASTGSTSLRSENDRSGSSSEHDLPTSDRLSRASRCDGLWNRASGPDLNTESQYSLKKVLTSSSRFSGSSKSTTSSRSKSKSSSKLTLPLDIRSSGKSRYMETWRHVARPRGESGQAIRIQDFF
ncbi:hypothetical protein LTR84_002802 [Exophiala bonariae]|uniref:F-box domain-containing protein n=1 Tax=Exophiala bonariae TaxID=1690606 RepID=A0AAV9NCE3_9EURO|nr:hypothetical protein LTR84_002802 [Exophiala bonariae]